MDDFSNHLNQALKDPAFKSEWEAQAAERELDRRVIEGRLGKEPGENELAERDGLEHSDPNGVEAGAEKRSA